MTETWETVALIAAVVRITGFAIDVVFFMYLLRLKYKWDHKSSQSSHRSSLHSQNVWPVRVLYISAIGAIVGFSLMQLFASLFLWGLDKLLWLQLVNAVVNIITLLSCLVFYVWRLRMAFQNSVYELKGAMLIIFIILLVSVLCLMMVGVICTLIVFAHGNISDSGGITNFTDDKDKKTSLEVAARMCLLLSLIMQALIMLLVSISFAKRLLNLVILQRRHTVVSLHSHSSRTNTTHLSQTSSGSGRATPTSPVASVSSDQPRSKAISVNRVAYENKIQVQTKKGTQIKTKNKGGDGTNTENKGSGRGGKGGNNNNTNHENHQQQQTVSIPQFSDRQRKLLTTVSKQAVLSLMAVFLILFNCTFLGLHWFLPENDKLLIKVNHLFSSIVYVILPMTIWLSFNFADKEYFFFCNVCHKSTQKCCEKLARNKIIKHYSLASSQAIGININIGKIQPISNSNLSTTTHNLRLSTNSSKESEKIEIISTPPIRPADSYAANYNYIDNNNNGKSINNNNNNGGNLTPLSPSGNDSSENNDININININIGSSNRNNSNNSNNGNDSVYKFTPDIGNLKTVSNISLRSTSVSSNSPQMNRIDSKIEIVDDKNYNHGKRAREANLNSPLSDLVDTRLQTTDAQTQKTVMMKSKSQSESTD